MLFDIPILLIVFNRPSKTQKLFDVIKKIKPKNLYVSCDGPRNNEPKDIKLCAEVKKIFTKIDWECNLNTNYSEKNKSCRINVIESINWFFSKQEKGIILEDDCIPDLTFFNFCKVLLDKYEFNETIMQINGHCNNQISSNNETYYFSKLNSTWGWATWKRAWSKFTTNMDDFEEMKNTKVLNHFYQNEDIAEWMQKYYEKTFKGKDKIWSLNWAYSILKSNGLIISPFKNLIYNSGFDGSGTSGDSKKFSKFSEIKVNSIEIINHPNQILYNKEYDENFFYNYVEPVDKRAKGSFLKKILKKLVNYKNEN